MTKAMRSDTIVFESSISSRAQPSAVKADGSSLVTITPFPVVELDEDAFVLPTSSDQTSPSAPRSFKFITKSSVSSLSLLIMLRDGVDGAEFLSSCLSLLQSAVFFEVSSSSFEVAEVVLP